MQTILKTLFSEYYHQVYGYLYSLTRDGPLAEELAAEVFLEAVKSIAAFRGEADAGTWLFSIARHRWLAWLRRKKREAVTETLSEFLPDPGQDVEKQYLDRALLQRVLQLLEQEPPRTRSIVRMRIEGYSFYEIGLRHQISESSARVIDFRAKAKIRKRLEEEGHDCV